MPEPIYLSLDANFVDIRDAILKQEGRAKKGLTRSPGNIAATVQDQIYNAQLMARAIDRRINDLALDMQVWDTKAGDISVGDTVTIVCIDSGQIKIFRGTPWAGAVSGRLTMRLNSSQDPGT